ncbi:MAG: DUF3990 domain-containing protein [Oscillospiraceae bacterium]|jgi:hypothetical protein|nr:DUF3990 domain-containing protein [Oscillospiraceae bacterium]
MTIRRGDGTALNNTNIITLYHGSIYDFNKIDVARGKPNKDFGHGFYTSRTEQQAVNLAKRNRQIEQNRLALISDKTQVPAWLYVYEFDLLKADALNVKEFKQADFDWVDFIVENRTSPNPQNDYDIVIGPTANDDTLITISALLNRTYGDPESIRAKELFLEFISADSLPYQTFFGTAKAASLLAFKDRRIIP